MRQPAYLLRWLLAAAVALTTLVGVPLAANAADDRVEMDIVNGGPITITQTPWQVALVSASQPNNRDAQFCGGSIIAARWIVTAAHCVDEANRTVPVSSVQVLAGVTALNTPAAEPRIDVSAIVVHHGYNSATKSNDIALLRLATPLDLSGNTRKAIALPSLPDQDPATWPAAGTDATISGWGDTELPPPDDLPVNLQGATVDVLTSPLDQNCGSYDQETYLADQMLCAGTAIAPVKDTCQGDSGGPLAIDVAGTWTLAGITSFGIDCADPAFPGVYTRVTSYTDWIAEVRALNWRDVSGAVSSSNGPVDTGRVTFYSDCNQSLGLEAIGAVDFEGGSYALSLPEGDYKAEISPRNGTGAVRSWHAAKSDCPSANAVTIENSPDPHPDRDLVALPGVNITGQMSSLNGPVPGGYISFYATCQDWAAFDPAGAVYFEGTYTVTIPAGDYRILLEPNGGFGAALSWHNAKSSCADADVVTVTEDGELDVTARTGSNITGEVTSAAGPASDVQVLYFRDCEAANDFDYSAWSFVGAPGPYTVTVPPGTYRVLIFAERGSNVETSWHSAKPNCAQSDVVTVTGNGTQDLVAIAPEPTPTPTPTPSPSGSTSPPAPPGPPTPSPTISPTPPPKTSQSVTKPPKQLRKGKKARLAKRTAQGQPATWRSATRKICTVTKRTVTARKKGKCRVVATAPGTITLNPYAGRFVIRIR